MNFLIRILCISFFTILFTDGLSAQQQQANNTQNGTQNAQQQQGNNKGGSVDNSPFDYGQLDVTPNVLQKSFEDSLYRVSLDTFEDGGNWYVSMPFDYGRAVLSMRSGAPDGVKNAPAEVREVNSANNKSDPSNPTLGSSTAIDNGGYFLSKEDTKKTVLGVKVIFFNGRRADPWMRIDAVQPIPLDGIVKGFELWVSGREIKNDLYVIVEDAFGKEQLISMGSLNYLGWRKLTAPVPSYIKQNIPHNSFHRGLIFKGLYVKFNMLDAMGTYFIYFDNLSAQISRYQEENLAQDDVLDNW